MEQFNQSAFQAIFAFAHQNFLLDYAGVFLARFLPYLLVFGFLVIVFRETGWRRRTLLFVEGVLAIILARGVVTEIIRFAYPYPRPFLVFGFEALAKEGGWSFPSGHAAFFFGLAVIVWYTNRRWGWWFLVLSLINGIARIFAGVHWPLDIAGGILVGLASGLLVHHLLARTIQALKAPSAQ